MESIFCCYQDNNSATRRADDRSINKRHGKTRGQVGGIKGATTRRRWDGKAGKHKALASALDSGTVDAAYRKIPKSNLHWFI